MGYSHWFLFDSFLTVGREIPHMMIINEVDYYSSKTLSERKMLII